MWTVPPEPSSPRDHARSADRFAASLDRLGDSRSHQRIGALHTLEAIADDDAGYGQAVANVLAAYLRQSLAGDDDQAVRSTAQQLLGTHLRPGPRLWTGVRLDLTDAVLTDLDLTGCRLAGLNLDRAVLHGSTRLRHALVHGAVSLRRTTLLDDAWFEHSVLRGPARFEGATFHGDAWFGSVRFGTSASFAGASFGGHAWFSGSDFVGRVEFGDAVFRRSAGFRGALVRAGAGLAGTTFLGPARVSRVGDGWNVNAPGWDAVTDPDNEAVGQLIWLGNGALIEPTPV
jgi:Pentapeptide repeats (9 copies)/Pentapeptide repeats (8 copies)